MDFEGYGWYLSGTATLLYLSWIVHNLVAWMKIKPFFTDKGSMFKRETGIWVRNIYLSTLALTVPVNIFQIFNNFRFFNNINDLINPWWKLSLVFKCLTDTIMLDDFKTELKRLGIIRIRKQEERRNSVALVLDDKEDGFGRELEFTEALNTNPARYHDLNNFNWNNASNPVDDLQGRLRHASMENGRGCEVMVEPHHHNGNGGTKIARLPGLSTFDFESIKPGKKTKVDSYVGDEEKGSATEEQIRNNSGHI
ncbi:hypothetical protein DV737_g155, partial [Chaetothyriales sp. CBS 132003]